MGLIWKVEETMHIIFVDFIDPGGDEINQVFNKSPWQRQNIPQQKKVGGSSNLQ